MNQAHNPLRSLREPWIYARARGCVQPCRERDRCQRESRALLLRLPARRVADRPGCADSVRQRQARAPRPSLAQRSHRKSVRPLKLHAAKVRRCGAHVCAMAVAGPDYFGRRDGHLVGGAGGVCGQHGRPEGNTGSAAPSCAATVVHGGLPLSARVGCATVWSAARFNSV